MRAGERAGTSRAVYGRWALARREPVAHTPHALEPEVAARCRQLRAQAADRAAQEIRIQLVVRRRPRGAQERVVRRRATAYQTREKPELGWRQLEPPLVDACLEVGDVDGGTIEVRASVDACRAPPRRTD